MIDDLGTLIGNLYYEHADIALMFLVPIPSFLPISFISGKSPMFGTVTSSLSGISTIRSANAQQRLIEQFDSNQVRNIH